MLKEIMTEGECSQLRSLIDTAETIVLCCHVNADGDALGSMLGWAEVLRGMGKDPLIVAPDQYPDYLKWLPNTEKIVRYDKRKDYVDMVLKIADLVFCLDFNTLSRTEAMAAALASSPAKKVLIDHHLEPDVDAVLTISHPEMSSTCELVFRIVWQMGLFEQQGKHFAIPVYCGMMTDTGGFTYNSSSPDIYFIISQLLTKHIDKDKIYRHVYHNYSEHRIRMVGYVLCHKLVVDEQRHAAFYTLTREDLQRFHFIKGDAEGLVNMPLQIKGLKLSISLREDSERDKLIWISLRSVDDFPCNKMAEMFFNGGGHLNASGGKLMCTMDEAVEVVKQAILHFEDTLK
ncbi:MAG: DHH family phosphoesterase [Prevotella sp.]|jgi:phosphoesterase RecJ-like protein|uniref:DHH family phosphoesterase n=1 Tax=Prevotella sp. tf2-5 TaxID=1761889 RepID=UPI0008F3A973|nr:DHH family phosphoesterase [Prevotella sp. tf2-5]MBR2245297.1 DHH family phosphoesterase [Prevotella sp.]MCR5712513.1 DHH family phosphoesterase [Prevotella sp.]SFO73828.1 phosphoesterase RecJ domain-containing protein [Prevotella sp. tf2-5]